MHSLINKLFAKRGIKSANELSPEEKADFDNWERILSKEELTTNDIKDFCLSQVDMIESKWRDLTIENERKQELIPYHTVYKALLKVIDSPH